MARLAGVSADPPALIRRFRAETDVSARRALLVALGDFPAVPAWAAEREMVATELAKLYREDGDAGLHGAIDWLLRQKWGRAEELRGIDAELTAAAKKADPIPAKKDWFVNGQGQTYTIVRDPVPFTLGSPLSETDRRDEETPHTKHIGRSFAIATKEATVEQFLKFRPKHDWTDRYSPKKDDGPIVSVRWYDAAEYCNWLSKEEGIPEEQWCYLPHEPEGYAEGMTIKAGHLKLTGYRLPTEAEWEYACRAGSAVSRYYGRSEELLGRYAWYMKNGNDHAWPGAGLRPNDLGLFDSLGNAWEWCEDPGFTYATEKREDEENKTNLEINNSRTRLLRGGAFDITPSSVRSAFRVNYRPDVRYGTLGFRPAKTLP